MRKFFVWILAATLWISHALHAQDALVGTWQGDLAVTPQTKVVVQFIVEKNAGGAYTARLNAPKEPNLQNVPVSAVAFERGQLTLQVDAVSGTYQGSLQDGGLRGTWTQQGTSFPLDLRPYVKPVLSQDTMRKLVGSWHGKVRPRSMPNGLALVMRFEMNARRELVAYLDVPDQGLYGVAQQVSVMDDNRISIKQDALKIEYVADFDGGQLNGGFKQRDIGPLPLVLQRGKYRENNRIVLSAVAKGKLRGAWNGELHGVMTLVLRFTENSDGSMQATLDSLDQGVRGLPVRDVQLHGEQLGLVVPGIKARFEGALSPQGIVGTYTQGKQKIALTLAKGEYVGHKVQLPSTVTSQLLGRWEGTIGSTQLVFRFERDSHGEAFAFLDVPRERMTGLPLTGLRMDDGAISFAVKAIPADFKGTLATNEMSGKWTTPNIQAPLVVKRVIRRSSGI